MAKKISAEATAPAVPAKRTPEEKAQRKAAKAEQHATKSLTDDRAEKKASQKHTLKSAAKQLQKELDARMSEVVTRIRKETKAKLKEVVKDATRRLDVDTERMFEQALHTIVRHYDSIPGRTADTNAPAPAAAKAKEASTPAQTGHKLNKDGSPRKARTSAEPDTTDEAPKKRAGRPAGTAPKAASAAPTASNGRRPGRPKRQAAEVATPELSTPAGTANDSVAVDNV